MHYQTFDQLTLSYATYGDPAAPPIVLIHGIGADQRMWQPQITSLPAAGYFVIVPDLRGHGSSASPPVFRIADCARDLRDLVVSLRLPRVHLVGVSMGGMVAQQMSLQYPELVYSQILVDSLSGITRLGERFNAGLAAFLLQFFPQKLQVHLIRDAYRKLGHDDVGQYFAERLLSMAPRWVLAARREVNRFSVMDELPHMRTPTLVLVGDAFGKLAVTMARTTAAGIPGAQFQLLPGGGDPSNLLAPAAFDQAVLTFLAQFP